MLALAQRNHLSPQLADELRQRGRGLVSHARLLDHLGQPAIPLGAAVIELAARFLKLGLQPHGAIALRCWRLHLDGWTRGTGEERRQPYALSFQLGNLAPGDSDFLVCGARLALCAHPLLVGRNAARLGRGQLGRELRHPPFEEDDLLQRGAQQLGGSWGVLRGCFGHGAPFERFLTKASVRIERSPGTVS